MKEEEQMTKQAVSFFSSVDTVLLLDYGFKLTWCCGGYAQIVQPLTVVRIGHEFSHARSSTWFSSSFFTVLASNHGWTALACAHWWCCGGYTQIVQPLTVVRIGHEFRHGGTSTWFFSSGFFRDQSRVEWCHNS